MDSNNATFGSELPQSASSSSGTAFGLMKVLRVLASLKITVVLFSLGMFLILAGTLAQATEGLWVVIETYFRSFFVRIPLQAFVPPAWFPDPDLQSYLSEHNYGFYFLGGKSIGAALMVNLLAAHIARFKVNASSNSIMWGLAYIFFGLLLTVMIILGASFTGDVQGQPIISYAIIYRTLLSALVAMAAAMTAGMFLLESGKILERVLLGTGILLTVIAIIALTVLGSMYEQLESAMRIVWQLTQATVVGCVLLVGCAMIFRNRGGIVLLHFGIAMMMVNELFVGMFAVEERITIPENESTRYAYNTQEVELAVIHHGPDKDTVVSIPYRKLIPGKTIEHPALPFRLRVEAYFPNSQLQKKDRPGDIDQIEITSRGLFSTRKTVKKLLPVCGRGVQTRARNIQRVAGAAAQQMVDMASAYVSILDAKIENAEIAESKDPDVVNNVLLLSQHYTERSTKGYDDGGNAERIRVNGKVYEISLRFRRVRKPYEVFLVDVKEESHHGSTTHKKFGSDFIITDDQGDVYNASISMNNPFRFRGETFYQSGYSQLQTRNGPVEVSTFQVVTNRSWMIPYIGCMYVVIGMLAQFIGGLLKFSERIQKRRNQPPRPVNLDGMPEDRFSVPADDAAADESRTMAAYAIPVVILLLGLLNCYTMTFGRKADPAEMDIRAAGQIPISSGGRFQPIDSLARVYLRKSSDYESVSLTDEQVERKLKGDRKRVYATEWLLDVITNPGMADKEYRIFRIYDPFLINKLQLEKKRKGYTYTYAEVTANINDFNVYVRKALDKQRKDGRADGLSFQQRKAVSLYRRFQAYENLRNMTMFFETDDPNNIRKLLNGRLLFHPVISKLDAPTANDQLTVQIARRIADAENARNLTYMQLILRMAQQGGSITRGQADNPLLSPTCEKPDLEVANKAERLALEVGPDLRKRQVQRGTLVRQTDDGTVWKLVNDRRASPTSPSKEPDWEIQPGMEVLTVAMARLALEKFRTANNIDEFTKLISELQKLDDDYFDWPEDPAKQNEFAAKIGNRYRQHVKDYLAEYKTEIDALYEKETGSPPTQQQQEKMLDQISRFYMMVRIDFNKQLNEEYQAFLKLFYKLQQKLELQVPGTDRLYRVLLAYKNEDVSAFNQAVADYKTFFDDLKLPDYEPFKVRLEHFYHYSTPLFQALIYYGVAALLIAVSWIFHGTALMGIGTGLQRSAMIVLGLGLLMNTVGIVERVIVTGKAPVTNLYASAVFIAWGGAVCGMLIEVFVSMASRKAARMGIGTLLGAIMGAVVLIVSFNLALRSDTFSKVQAVLDTQFWLATHVICVTFGYVATFVAGCMGLVYLVGSLFLTSFDKDVRRGVSWITYGIVCFALLLSFFGTVLGGLWADDSWGRFWGWDPKENGALLIVLWNALILHARWGGMIRERGLALLALGGNIVTCWSWFGVNELGVGLHSYGFTEGLLAILGWLAVGHLAVIGLFAAIPTRYWAGYREPGLPEEILNETSKEKPRSGSGKKRKRKR